MSKQQTLSEILEQIEQNQVLADTDPLGTPGLARAGFAVAIRQAKDTLTDLKKLYRTQIMSRAYDVFVFGNRTKATEFGKVAEAEGAVVVDAEELYQTLAQPIEASLGTEREFGPSQVALLIAGLKAVATDLGIINMNAPKLPGLVKMENAAVTLAHVRSMIRAAVGDDLNKLYLGAAITNKALEAKYKASGLVVVVLNAMGPEDARGIAGLFAHHLPSVNLTSDVEIDVDTVHRAFKRSNNKPPTLKNETKEQS